MKQAMEDAVNEVLSGVVEDVGQAVDRNVTGAQVLQELLSAPWLRALLKIYERLLEFQRVMPSPLLPYASGLSLEILTHVQKPHRPSAEARELHSLLRSPHIQALLSAHDSVARSDYGPVLPPLPDTLPEDEEAIRIVCLVKNNQPLNGGRVGMSRSHWSSLRQLTPDRVVPTRRARSGEELRLRARPSLPCYEPTGGCCSCQKGLNRSAPSVFSGSEKPKPDREDGSSDDYAYPPPPVPAYSLSLPSSPLLNTKGSTGGPSRNIPTPGRTPSGPHRAQTAPSSPAAQRSTRQQGVSTLSDRGQIGPSTRLCTELPRCSTARRHRQHPDLSRQLSVEELRSSVQAVTGSIEHHTHDVHHLGQKMVAATEMITDRMEENAQALTLLAEVVDKLQGLIVANKQPPAPDPRRLSASSSNSCSSSSSSTSLSSCAGSFVTHRSPKRASDGSKRTMGATIKRDEETGEIYVARVIHGGLADRSGLLHPGDMLVEVNGNPVGGLEPEQVIQILINSQGTILFKVIPNSAQIPGSQKPVYMKAMVDYCPQQDPSIPCPDAGMAFSRGDLLEVVDQSDAQWWQARKLPCTASCAAVVPSASMLKSKQREQWWCQPLHVHTCIQPLTPADHDDDLPQTQDKRTGTDLEDIRFDQAESDMTDGIYLAGFRRSFRLWRRTSYRRRRQSCTSCSPNATMSFPYDEVVLYQRPRQENHRLIILVGASGVGVNELRKRLIKLNPSTFQGPVPHTTRPLRAEEQMGREYHFITKELFEYMACNHRFVEYGEYRGHLYGTSTDAIDDVLKQGRVCLVDVEAHSIPALRTRKLKPYVIFIKAPSPESLRQTRRDSRLITNYAINRVFTEDDFRELEEVSGLIEAKYKQFFDSVLVNDDLQDSCIQLCSIIQQAQDEPQWIPVSWSRTEE